MIKSELILRLAARHEHLVQKDAEIAVNLLVGAMIDALAHGRRIEIRGFGSFSLRQRKARNGRNPRTGERVYVPLKSSIYFRPTGELKRRVDAGTARGAKEMTALATSSVASEGGEAKSGNKPTIPRDLMSLLEITG